MLLPLLLTAAAQSPEDLPLPGDPPPENTRTPQQEALPLPGSRSPAWARRLKLADAGMFTMGGGALLTGSGAALALIDANQGGGDLMTIGLIEAGTGVAAIGGGLVLTQVGSLGAGLQLRKMGHRVPVWSGMTALGLFGLGSSLVVVDLMAQTGVVAGFGAIGMIAAIPFTVVQRGTIHAYIKRGDMQRGVPLVEAPTLQILPTASWGLDGPRFGVVGRF